MSLKRDWPHRTEFSGPVPLVARCTFVLCSELAAFHLLFLSYVCFYHFLCICLQGLYVFVCVCFFWLCIISLFAFDCFHGVCACRPPYVSALQSLAELEKSKYLLMNDSCMIKGAARIIETNCIVDQSGHECSLFPVNWTPL